MKTFVVAIWLGLFSSAFSQEMPKEAAAAANLVVGSEQWLAERQRCYDILEVEFRDWMRTAKQLEQFKEMIARYDAQYPHFKNPWRALCYARVERERLRQEAEAERIRIASQGAPDWKSHVMNSTLREQFDAEEDVGSEPAYQPSRNRITYLPGGQQKRNGVITKSGNFASGYTISGDKLTRNGSVTHTRSGVMWMPVASGERQIHDP